MSVQSVPGKLYGFLDNVSQDMFKKSGDRQVQKTAIQLGLTAAVGSMSLVRGRPIVAVTKGEFTKFGRALAIASVVTNVPVALLAAYELHRRKHRGPFAHLDELQRLLRSGNVSRIEELRNARKYEDPRTWHGDVYTAANDPRRFGSD